MEGLERLIGISKNINISVHLCRTFVYQAANLREANFTSGD